MKAPRLRGADITTLVAVYAVGAAVWILLSDSLLLLTDSHRIAAVVSVSKGLLFVAVTSLLLYLVLIRIRERRDTSGTRRHTAGFERTVGIGIALATLVILTLGALQVRELVSSKEQGFARQLAAIAELKVDQLEDWLRERSGDARMVGHQLARLQPFDRLQENETRIRLEELRQLLDLQALLVFDEAGKVVASGSGEHRSIDAPLVEVAAQVLAARTALVRVSRHVHRDHDNHPHLDFVAPIPGSNGEAGLAVLLRTDAGHLQSLLLEQGPIPGETTETLLFRRVGADIEFIAGPVRESEAMPGRQSAGKESSLEARIAAGELTTGSWLEGTDHRGVEVAGFARQVAETDWTLLSKIDRRELSHDLVDDLTWMVGALSVALVLPFAVGLLLSQRHHLRVMQLTDRQREERVALAYHQDSLMQRARDMILLVDDQDYIVDANESALRTLGWSLGELQSMTITELRAPETRDDVESRRQQVESGDGALYESEYVCRDGSTIPVEINARSFEMEGRIFRQAFVRNISERRTNQARIERLSRLYHALSNCNQAIVRSHDRRQLFREVCRSLVESGAAAMVWIGLPDDDRRVLPVAVHGDGGERYTGGLDITTDPNDPQGRGPTGTCLREGREVWTQDFLNDERTETWHERAAAFGWRASAALPVSEKGKVVACLNVYESQVHAFEEDERKLLRELTMDISYALDHLSTIEALKRSEERWSFALEGAAEGVWDWDMTTNRIYFSPRWKQMLGYADVEIGNRLDDWKRRVHPDDIDGALAGMEAHAAGQTDLYASEHRLRTSGGDYIWVLDRGKVVSRDRDGRPLRMIGTHADITARKRIEATLREQTRLLEESQRIGRIGNWTYRPDEYRFSCSAQSMEILGMAERDAADTLDALLDRVPEDERTKLRVWFESIANHQQPGEILFRITSGNGEIRWLSARGRVDGDEHDPRPLVIGTMQDVSEWRHASLRIEQQLDELRRWNRVTLDREERILELKREINILCRRLGDPPRYGGAIGARTPSA